MEVCFILYSLTNTDTVLIYIDDMCICVTTHRFVLVHIAGKCRRQVLLEYFNQDTREKSGWSGQQIFQEWLQGLTSIAYAIPKCTSAEDIATLFGVLGGQLPLEKAAEILPGCKAITGYIPEHKAANWEVCHGWTQWWLQEKHLSKCATSSAYYICLPTPSTGWHDYQEFHLL